MVIGVFDSGVGGLSVWREIVRLMPEEPTLYLADQAHVPYGPRSLTEVRDLTTHCINWLLGKGCAPIVIACNTASAAALHFLRGLHPSVPFVGMEPAVKPAAYHTHTGVIGVLATEATFQSELFASVVVRFASNVKVIEQACPGWVTLVEGANTENAVALSDCQPLVEQAIVPLLEAGADSLVLGCTHFPFLSTAIHRCVAGWMARHTPGYDIALIDPSQAVARQVMRVRDQLCLSRPDRSASYQFCTTGNATAFTTLARYLLSEHLGMRAAHVPYAEILEAQPHPIFMDTRNSN